MFPHCSDYMSQGSQVSQSALCFSKVSWSQSVSHKGTYRAVRGQLKTIDFFPRGILIFNLVEILL